MLKSITVAAKFLLSASFLFGLASCDVRGIKGSGNVTIENRPISGEFKSVEVGNALELTIIQGNRPKITVEADDNVQKHIRTEIENGVLVIKCDFNSYMNVTKKITVEMPVIEAIDAGSGSNVNSGNTLHVQSIEIHSSNGADVNVALEAEKASCESSLGSHISLTGKVIKLETSSSSGSDIDAKELLSNDIIASASSGSTIDVHPLVSLNAKASSGGNVNYNNQPKTLIQHANSGGSINNQE